MKLHNLAVLEQAEKKLKSKLQRQHTFGEEIEDLKFHAMDLLPVEEQAFFFELYAKAKKEAPEIWEHTVQSLPSDLFSEHETFFEELGDLNSIRFLAQCYPEKKEDLKSLYAMSPEIIDTMYWHLHWHLNKSDIVKDYKKLRREAVEIYEIQKNNIKSAIEG